MKKQGKSIEDNTNRNKTSLVNRRDSELSPNNEIMNIFPEEVANAKTNRRDFLKYFGFSIASAAVISSCEQPVRKSIPYLIRPEQVTPGKASYYASTYYDGNEYGSILVKVRDGRPIKIEGNDLSLVSGGKTSAGVQASVLGLYDDNRMKYPSISQKEVTWEEIDKEIIQKLEQLSSDDEQIILMTSSVISPSTKEVIKKFQKKYSTVKHVIYDAISASAMLDANDECFGERALPTYHFDKAKLIVSIGADFLGTWLSPAEYAAQFSKTRSLTEGQKEISKLVQFESNMSLTGSNADKRIRIKPSEEKEVLIAMFNEIALKTGHKPLKYKTDHKAAKTIAHELVMCPGKSIVVSGSNDIECQILVNGMNYYLENLHNTIDLRRNYHLKQGSDKEIDDLTKDLRNNKVKGIILYNVNPVYDYAEGLLFEKALKDAELSVSLSPVRNESAEAVKYCCPDHHYLESWNDAEIYTHSYSLAQPVIRPLFNTRQAQDTLLAWSGTEISYNDLIKDTWKENMFPKTHETDFRSFWNKSLRDGVFGPEHIGEEEPPSINYKSLDKVRPIDRSSDDAIELCLYESTAIRNGVNANNPWLQELPDPVTRITWDNYASVSPAFARKHGLKTGSRIKINGSVVLPVLIQPGQDDSTIGASLGYGRTKAGKVAEGVGKNMFPMVPTHEGYRLYSTPVKIEKTEGSYPLAIVQPHHSMEGRDIVRNATLKDYIKNPSAGNEMHEEIQKELKSIYEGHDYPGHHWGMAIDLNKCTGCSACVIACTVENNVPAVGKKEVLRAHEMQWIRIDRYYEGSEDDPKTLRQPVMCQHCDNAPCENVCPVAATNHSDEGLNQMAYNRCIGTRYCNNNCPYKVRRFNWFDFTKADSIKNNTVDPVGMTVDLKRMVLNPDVTVRSKGVIEKCSFCVQRIQEKKLDAKLAKKRLEDGEIKTACMQACPADAIVFGDMNDPESKVSKLFKDKRNYHLLEELDTLPSVGYLTKISHHKG
jgi:Fe-S-cluster-containing dehydrogenase component/anaerobic selenocysteine-containing dehydrogenase